jgi:hypothetical protein
MDAEVRPGAPCQTQSLWQAELYVICRNGDQQMLLDLCGKFRLKPKHLELPFAFPISTRGVSNSKLKGSEPREFTTENATPLHVACYLNNGKIVRALINSHQQPVSHLVFDSHGRTPFKAAVDAGANFAFNEIEGLMSTSDISSQLMFQWDLSGQTPFHSAVANGYRSMSKRLYEAGSNVNTSGLAWVRDPGNRNPCAH